jgi:AcrR family transcriptional regulator
VRRDEATRRPARKPKHAYHHGDLRQALVQQALVTIQEHGVEALTLRQTGERLRVSRTALYRHFADKQALLAAVATEGFALFERALAEAWGDAAVPASRERFYRVGRAYVDFARRHPSHYRVMFGRFVDNVAADPALAGSADRAFGVLVTALEALQGVGLVRRHASPELAVSVWACTHGLAMLFIDGQLSRPDLDAEAMVLATLDRVWDFLTPR